MVATAFSSYLSRCGSLTGVAQLYPMPVMPRVHWALLFYNLSDTGIVARATRLNLYGYSIGVTEVNPLVGQG